MNLSEIVKRLKLKYKIVNGTVYAVIEDDGFAPYPTVRPAFDEEITEAQRKETINKVLKANTKKKEEPRHAPKPPMSPFSP